MESAVTIKDIDFSNAIEAVAQSNANCIEQLENNINRMQLVSERLSFLINEINYLTKERAYEVFRN